MSFLLQVAGWLTNPAHWQGPNGIPTRLEEHIVMSVISTLVAVAIALPVGLTLGHYGVGGAIAINISNIGRALPSFAILVLAVQIFGIGATPAFLSLVALAIPPIVTNSFVGMRDVDPELRDAARGLGFRERRTLLRVEIPSAIPVVMAGIRTAGVQVVATATLAALVGWGGLGRYILDGFANRDRVEIFAGAFLVAVLALATEAGLAGLQYLFTPAGLRSQARQEAPTMLAGQSAQAQGAT